MTIAHHIRTIIAEQAVLDLADVSLDSRLDALGLDSLGLVETIFAIEEAYDVSVPFNANDPAASGFDLSTVGSVVMAVERLVAAKAA